MWIDLLKTLKVTMCSLSKMRCFQLHNYPCDMAACRSDFRINRLPRRAGIAPDGGLCVVEDTTTVLPIDTNPR
jgi:hypothetical protein